MTKHEPVFENSIENDMKKDKITLDNFSPTNRTKNIGYSMYRICNTDGKDGKGDWYIHETYNNGTEWSGYNYYHNADLKTVLDIFNGLSLEKEIVSLKP